MGRIKNEQPHLDRQVKLLLYQSDVIILSCLFGNFWEPFLNIKMRYIMVRKKNDILFVPGWDRRIRP